MTGRTEFELLLWVADGPDDEDEHRYTTEYPFDERPERETVARLFDEAKQMFAELYPDADATHFSVYLQARPYYDVRTSVDER